MFDIHWTVVKLLFQWTNSMVVPINALFAVSLSVNVCTILYCACERLQKCLKDRCCCGPNHCIVHICQIYQDKTQDLSKAFTEQVTVLISSSLAIIVICSTNIIRVPFSGNIEQSESVFIQIVLAINIGRYVYLILQDAYLFPHIDKARFRTDTVHHVVTIVCYSVILVYRQNMLLGILGILTELNTFLVEVTKIMKTLGRHKTSIYKKMSVASCATTIVFRGVIPVIFLIMGMFHETPFVMHYTALTVFFLSIIFFSVINVWLILSTVQRVIKIYSYSETLEVAYAPEHIQLESFRKNNLGYERPLGNININYDTEKLNINKSIDQNLISKIKNVYLTQRNDHRDIEMNNVIEIDSTQSIDSSSPEPSQSTSNRDRSIPRNSCLNLLPATEPQIDLSVRFAPNVLPGDNLNDLSRSNNENEEFDLPI